MSIDYFIFLQSYGDIVDIVGLLTRVNGVHVHDGNLQINGLLHTECSELDAAHRETMLGEYGEYGLNVNWLIRGTLDETADSGETVERLFRCTAAIINAYPLRPVSLMREAESFYVFNTANELIVPPAFVKAYPAVISMFEKRVACHDLRIR